MINIEELTGYIKTKYIGVKKIDVRQSPFNRDGTNIIIVRLTSTINKEISIEMNYDHFIKYIREKKLNKICKLIKF